MAGTVRRRDQVPVSTVMGDDLVGVTKQLLVGRDEGWDGWAMRLFTVAPGGHTPRHTHDWPHINVVLSGRGILHVDGDDHTIQAGTSGFVPAGSSHQFTNSGDQPLEFVCIVPEAGEY
jgi:quercetin dioxygenase-like cupin family protein